MFATQFSYNNNLQTQIVKIVLKLTHSLLSAFCTKVKDEAGIS